MSTDNKSIHEFELQILCEYFSNFDRQGPGSTEVTLKALSFIDNLTNESRIADIGCGTGGQTRVLAQHIPGTITAIDLFPEFIELFNNYAAKVNLQDRVTGMVGDMKQLTFLTEELDLIWSEGSIYNIGFEKGFQEWRRFLKKDGYIAVTEATWFTDSRPAEVEQFWVDAYPEIDTISNKVAQIQKAGYKIIATFILPETCWIDHFFKPQVPVQKEFIKKHAGNKTAEDLINYMQYEAQMYDKYHDYYGYIFYIAQKFED